MFIVCNETIYRHPIWFSYTFKLIDLFSCLDLLTCWIISLFSEVWFGHWLWQIKWVDMSYVTLEQKHFNSLEWLSGLLLPCYDVEVSLGTYCGMLSQHIDAGEQVVAVTRTHMGCWVRHRELWDCAQTRLTQLILTSTMFSVVLILNILQVHLNGWMTLHYVDVC
jgi:hypothetical protein